jgi:aminoglycoside phosphotransferase (APT) family kinase protein
VLHTHDRVSGVIDFGDLCAGDPATDLAAAWQLFDARARAVLFTTYLAGRSNQDGNEDDVDLFTRARGWAIFFGVTVLAHAGDDPAYAAVVERTLRQLLLWPEQV